jgi:small subunit ribosomal protein S6
MTIRVEEHETGPSAILRKDERSERPFGDRADRGGERSERPRRAPRETATSSEGEAA